MAHERWMREALREAEAAASRGETPVGAVVAKNDEIVARAGNRCKADGDPTAHAEMLAMREAARGTGGRRLSGCTRYVTLEPCPRCAGAIALMRPDAVIFGAYDDRFGCCGSVYRLTEDARLGLGVVPAYGGVLEKECAEVLASFFAKRRRT